MTKIYRVEVAKLTWDSGASAGRETVSYYASKAKAERVAAELEANRIPWNKGGEYDDVYIKEFELDTEA